MTAEQRVVSALMGYPPLTDLIADRLYPLVLPQNCPLPAAVYFKVSAPRVHSLSGQSGLANVRIQVTTWARTYPEVKGVAEAMRLAFATNLPEARVISERDRYEDNTKLFGVDLDVEFFHPEATTRGD